MKQSICSVVILGPEAPRPIKLAVTRRAVRVLAFGFGLVCLTALYLRFKYPEPVDENSWAQLVEENRALKLEAMEAAKGIEQLNLMVSTLEAKSKRIDQLSVSENGD